MRWTSHLTQRSTNCILVTDYKLNNKLRTRGLSFCWSTGCMDARPLPSPNGTGGQQLHQNGNNLPNTRRLPPVPNTLTEPQNHQSRTNPNCFPPPLQEISTPKIPSPLVNQIKSQNEKKIMPPFINSPLMKTQSQENPQSNPLPKITNTFPQHNGPSVQLKSSSEARPQPQSPSTIPTQTKNQNKPNPEPIHLLPKLETDPHPQPSRSSQSNQLAVKNERESPNFIREWFLDINVAGDSSAMAFGEVLGYNPNLAYHPIELTIIDYQIKTEGSGLFCNKYVLYQIKIQQSGTPSFRFTLMKQTYHVETSLVIDLSSWFCVLPHYSDWTISVI